MTVWYVHRRDDGEIASAHEELQPGYAEEGLDDATNPEIVAYRKKVAGTPRISVSRLRLKLALAAAGKLDAVEAAVVAAGAVAQLYWANATAFESDHRLVAQIGAALGMTTDEIYALFVAARDMDA